ncbi:3-hydroxyacyl-CoA dehydrogenase [Virgibacillus phasianinus]|uniref:3-hydroxyacyl-CoA dehydrogenase n=1 Tax=Virgibacillus phasianinus TaxID=2017483 RepID=A0A220U1D0_9BACI|nr:thioesterase family protein [Virgibacillus phasianinus]ASK61890.1 3-hydroxyacyl-CoA dehydrogenase [Virgibacillus phasianinus]
MALHDGVFMKERVRPEWVDYNGHMNDAEYSRVFSLAVDQLMNEIGIDENFREQQQYSIFTLETHLCYLAEANEGESLGISVQLLDSDTKRLHVFFVMEDEEGKRLATSEQMLMGMDMKEGRPAPFPAPVASKVSNLASTQENQPIPDEAGRKIGIRKK